MSTPNLLQPPSTPRRRSASPASTCAGVKMPVGYYRHRLPEHHSFNHAVQLLQRSSNIIVLTGAGISTSVGIRDFRSQEGVHAVLRKKGFDSPEDLFHIDTFRYDPEKFYDALEILLPPEDVAFSPTHAFIKLIQDKNKLLRNFTQNIDGLEEKAGVDHLKIVQCHGGLAPGVCITCDKHFKAKHFLPVIRKRVGAPRCNRCDSSPGTPHSKPSSKRKTNKRRRDEWEDDESEDENRGVLKPSIVFYGEHVSDAYTPQLTEDRLKADLLLVIGTSLKVEPVNLLLAKIPQDVPQIFISKERCQMTGVHPDIELLGECDVIVEELARRANWDLTHEMLPKEADAGSIKIETLMGTDNKHLVRRQKSRLVNSLSPMPTRLKEDANSQEELLRK